MRLHLIILLSSILHHSDEELGPFSRDLAVFRDKKATIPDIHAAGIRLVAAMYGCDTDLNGERAEIFMALCNDIKRRRKVTLDRLPPTADAVGLHAQRSYLQIQEWSGTSLRPELYGWKKVDGILEPIPMSQEPASPFLMEVKKCGCTSGCRNRICRCVADGLACTDKCSCGETYENPKNCLMMHIVRSRMRSATNNKTQSVL